MTDDETIANSFNDYFVNVGKSLAHNIVSNVDPLSYVERSNECITDIVITVDDVKSIVSQLNNSAAGHDDLPPSIMKQLCTEYCVPLTYIINLSITQGDFPEELKLAKVLPIYKNDDEQLIQNYRPISVLPFYSKIFEKVIYYSLLKQTISYMINNLVFEKDIRILSCYNNFSRKSNKGFRYRKK